MKYIIANWKANKDLTEAIDWVNIFVSKIKNDQRVLDLLQNKQLSIVIAPSFPLLLYIKSVLQNMTGVDVAAQDCSVFGIGSHTGEVPASTLKGMVNLTIVGHSERRHQLNETEAMIESKIEQLEETGIKSLLCIRNDHDHIYESASFVAYEPIDAIGSGHNKTVEEIVAMKDTLSLKPHQAFIYGGSVNDTDCLPYLESNAIDGLLVGKASLDPQVFYSIISQLKK